jgi:hypothetical protein
VELATIDLIAPVKLEKMLYVFMLFIKNKRNSEKAIIFGDILNKSFLN